ncbi:MAG: biotin--[acetyl-CoA-carboxylase] ligase, partial [Burkholderiaceae bacterium]
SLGEQIDRNELLSQLIDGLVDVLAVFDAHGLTPFIDRWQRWHAFAGLPVRVTDQNRLLYEGVARGIDAEGCLQLETATSMVVVAAGDVSLRASSQGQI